MKVLVADDDRTTREMIVSYLQEKGFTVRPASEGNEALHVIESESPGIAVLDWMMPGINGIEICRQIREQQRRNYVYIIILTAKESSEDLLSGFEAGIDEYVQKPANLRELHARIKVGMRIVNLEQQLTAKQQKLYELIQVKNKFIGIAAHDLRNPAISIRGFSELLLKDAGNLTDEQQEFISIIQSTSNNMLDLLNDLLELSQIESGNLELKKTPASLKTLIEERLRLYRLQADNKRIKLHHELADLPQFAFDHKRIGQAIDNLISNAIKFSPQGTNVYLSLQQDGGTAIFSIQDEGPGIPSEEQDLVFTEFQRLSVRPTDSESSTGLGLAITKRIIETHGGHISFKSRVGVGTVFTIELPITGEEVPQNESAHEA